MENLEAYLELKNKKKIQVPIKEELLQWQKRGLQYTATGYGRKIPTSYKIQWHNRWYRVYCCIYSNSGTLYIENKKKWLFVDIY